jgi:benzoyl-CoA reductase/2-hydroxyglutaryl-CoA dehydratase subunit BcrC/BadD/HgdB
MEYHNLPIYKVGVPAEWNKSFARNYYLKSLKKLQAKLEEVTGNTLSNEALKAEVEKTNKIHDLLRKIDALRKDDKPVVGGLDFIKMNHASLRVSPDQSIKQLEKIYADLQKAEPIPGKGPRILIAGHIVADGDYAVPGLIEEAGGKIVADMIDDGMRWYRWDTPTDGDMLENIKQARYVDRTPNNLFQPSWSNRLEDLQAIIKEYKIDAVIWYQLSFDEIYDMEYAVISKKMNGSIPMLKLESSYEYSRESMGPLQTRIESFIESVKEGK